MRKVQSGLAWIISGDLVVARTIGELADYLEVSRGTVRRWLRGERIPRPVAIALEHLVGRLASPAWRDFHVDEAGRLWSSNGYAFTPAELEHFSLIMQTNRVLWRVQRDKADSDRENGEAVQGRAADLPPGGDHQRPVAGRDRRLGPRARPRRWLDSRRRYGGVAGD